MEPTLLSTTLWAAVAIALLICWRKAPLSWILARIGSTKEKYLTGNGLEPRSWWLAKFAGPSRESPGEPEYRETFPPSRRSALPTLAVKQGHLGSAGNKANKSENGFKIMQTKHAVPLRLPVDQLTGDEITSTGITIREIRALGDFPDYAALSGVSLPAEDSSFGVETTIPRPYRPLRWSYHQTMSLAKLEPDWWIEIENTYTFRIKQRQQIYLEDPKAVLQWLPGSEFACKELMEMAIQFLCARYPRHFSLNAEQTEFSNAILGTVTNLKSTDPLLVLLNNVPEDYAIMMRNPANGLYYLRAAVICTAQGWTVDTKIGKLLEEIHEPVPHYREKMQYSMNRFFAKLPTDKPIQRGAWSIEIDQPLYVPPGDPREKDFKHQQPDLELSRCHLRVDWQTLRRLPLTGGVVFNFKAFYTPVSAFRDEPYVPALCLKILQDGNETLMKYKHTWHVEHVVKPALERWKTEQVERGLMPEGWEEKTLQEAPFFPGWQEKWKAAQGL